MFFMYNSARELLHGVNLVVYNHCLNYGCAANCKDKSENHHNTNPFFNFVILILLPVVGLTPIDLGAFCSPFVFTCAKLMPFVYAHKCFID